jgi:diaminopimelate epimerase
MKFAKYHGTGNDFVMIEDLDGTLSLSPALIAALCHRRKGAGGDGVIRITRTDGADFFMDYYNANGEVAEMCGNGIRCLAKYVYDRGITRKDEIDVQTRAGLKHLRMRTEDGAVRSVTVDMGPPAFERKAIPMSGDPTDTFLVRTLEVGDMTFSASAVSMGNPHVVVFLDDGQDLGSFDVPGVGSTIEHLPLFPNRTNVEFVKAAGDRIVLRVWERGSGETMACGTGACAALAASSQAGLVGREAEIEFPGGLLRVAWAEEGHLFLTGPAVCVYDGVLDDAWLTAQSVGTAQAVGAAGAVR